MYQRFLLEKIVYYVIVTQNRRKKGLCIHFSGSLDAVPQVTSSVSVIKRSK